MDRDSLLAVHALRAGLIDGDQLAELQAARAGDRTRSMAGLLLESGSVSEAGLLRIERLVDRDLGPASGGAGVPTISDPDARGDDFATLVGPEPGETAVGDPSARDPTRIGALAGPSGPPPARYERSRLHARGGVGQVWLVVDSDQGCEVALKELRPDLATDSASWDRFFAEAQIIGQLAHPGIVPVYEFATDLSTRRPFYTMRFVRGRTLADAISAYHRKRAACEPVPYEFEALLIDFVAACDAIGYAHSQGIIHRDIKGQNIVLGDSGEVMVLDWGLAKRVGQPDIPADPAHLDGDPARDATLQGQVLGTPYYMAPEQAEGRIEAIGIRTDIYGLGTILYEILAGRPPHEGGTTAELLRHVREDDPAPPCSVVPDAPRPLEAICLRAMAHHPECRYASALELADDVRRWLLDGPAPAEPPDPAPGRSRGGPPSARMAPSRPHRRLRFPHGIRREMPRRAHDDRVRARR